MGLPSNELMIFHGLCEDLAPDALAAVRERVRAYVLELEAAQSRSEFVAIDLAKHVGDRLERVLALAPGMSAAERALVVGAARYFTSKDDAIPDMRACTGLDDDVRIVNHVLRQLGRDEWLIEE